MACLLRMSFFLCTFVRKLKEDMRLLLVLLSVMTFTVQDKRTVATEGILPNEMSVSYSCTYQKGDVRAGDTATLVVNGLAGITVEGIAVYLKSNKSAGAGIVTMTADGDVLLQQEGTYKEWFSAYNNAESQPLSWTGQKNMTEGTMQVQVIGKTNSLHIEKYEISWIPIPTDPRVVTLMNGAESMGTLKEQRGGEGVVLPQGVNQGEWTFTGWSETEFWEIEMLPELHPANTVFYPASDCRLWAVYCRDNGNDLSYVTELGEEGVYIYMDAVSRRAIRGVPEKGIMQSAEMNLYDEVQYYIIVFQGTDTAYIYSMQDETPIGYSGKQLAVAQTPWRVYHAGEETLFYTTINDKNYVLWPSMMDASGEVNYAGLLQADPGPSSLRLLAPGEQKARYTYTCHPEAAGIEITDEVVNGVADERVLIQFGEYELVIRNGRKQLRQR